MPAGVDCQQQDATHQDATRRNCVTVAIGSEKLDKPFATEANLAHRLCTEELGCVAVGLETTELGQARRRVATMCERALFGP
jgi:hypothetical protein